MPVALHKTTTFRATLGPIFQAHYKELEAARTDQVPRIRRMDVLAEDLYFLYAGPAKKRDGKSSFLQGK